ncbi:MAG: radical SAM protein [Elusimicrobiales bacterium]|nr:radical SAM protein [Elusimicrobiales bacterium]
MIVNPARADHLPREEFLLEVFLTNRCNLDCSYCSSRRMIDEPVRRALTFEQVKRAVDVYAAYRRRPGSRQERTIFFTGGEPFLEYDTLRRAVEYIDSLPGKFRVRIATNATLLAPERIKFLLDRDVRIFVSLDGCRKAHDRHRTFRGGRGSFGSIDRALRRIPSSVRGGGNFCVSATFTSETAKWLPESLDYFRGLGISVVEICPEAYEVWKPADIARASAVLAGVARERLHRRFEGGDAGPQFVFSNSSAPDNAKWSLADYKDTLLHSVSFMYDGYFYPCEAVFGGGLDAKYRIGDTERGIDRRRAERVYASALARIGKCSGSVGTLLTAGRYYYARNAGLDPADYFENARRVNDAFDSALGGYLRAQRLHDAVTALPAFGDFAHSPRLAAGREVSALALEAAPGSDPARLRACLDYFLHSPGVRKSLVIRRPGGAAGTASALALYALSKSGRLKKKISVSMEESGVPPS